jgi:hypothetical protein
MQGFLEGAKLGKFDFTALLECVMVADKTAISAYEDVDMAIEAWKKKDYMEGVASLIMLVAIKQGVQQSVQMCSQVDRSIFDNFEVNPLAFSKKEVKEKLNEAMVAHEQGKLYEFGKDIGAAMGYTNDKNMYIY